MYRASSAWAPHMTVAALFCDSSLLHSSNCVWGSSLLHSSNCISAAEDEAGQSASANDNEESTGDNCHQYILVVNAITLYSCTIKLQYIVLGDYWECVRPALLPVNQSYELRPPRELHLRYVPHRVRNGYNRSLKAKGTTLLPDLGGF